MLGYIKALGPNEELSLKLLSRKLAALVCVHTSTSSVAQFSGPQNQYSTTVPAPIHTRRTARMLE